MTIFFEGLFKEKNRHKHHSASEKAWSISISHFIFWKIASKNCENDSIFNPMTQCSRGKYIVQPATIWEMWLHFLSGKSTEGVMELLITLLLWLVQQQQQQQNKHANWPYNYYYVGEQTNTCKTWRRREVLVNLFVTCLRLLQYFQTTIKFLIFIEQTSRFTMALSWALKNKGSFFGGHSKCV